MKRPDTKSKAGRNCFGNNQTGSQAIILDFVVQAKYVQGQRVQQPFCFNLGGAAKQETTQNKTLRGFVPLESINTELCYDLFAISNGVATGNVQIAADRKLRFNFTLAPEINIDQLVIIDDNAVQLGILTRDEYGSYQNEAGILLPASVQNIHCLTLYADDAVGTDLFHIQW